MKKLIKILIAIILIVAAIFLGVYCWFRFAYNIDIFRTFGQLRTLSEPVDEATLCPNAFTDEDMPNIEQKVNEHVEGLIDYSEENGYTVDLNNLPEELNGIITLSDREIGALSSTLVKQALNNEITIEGNTLGFEVKQVIIDLNESDVPLFTVTVAIDVTSLKENLNSFPLSLVMGYIPDTFYVSSTVLVERPDGAAFAYAVSSHSMTINNLSATDTKELYGTVNNFIKLGELDTFNTQIGKTIIDALIGNENTTGLAYSLKEIGASDYEFSKGSFSVIH